jgi:hypothetical protein
MPRAGWNSVSSQSTSSTPSPRLCVQHTDDHVVDVSPLSNSRPSQRSSLPRFQELPREVGVNPALKPKQQQHQHQRQSLPMASKSTCQRELAGLRSPSNQTCSTPRESSQYHRFIEHRSPLLTLSAVIRLCLHHLTSTCSNPNRSTINR